MRALVVFSVKVTFLIATLLAAGCHGLLPFGPAEDRDTGAKDRSVGDRAPPGDGAPLDRRPDSEDQMARAPDGTATREASTADAMPVAEGGQPYGGCDGVFAKELDGIAGMSFCQGLSPVPQGLASTLCDFATGWHLCPASVYRSVFHQGAQPPPHANFWIAGCCQQQGSSFGPPTDGACMCVSSSLVAGPQISIPCALPGALYAVDKCNGVVTALTCNKLGYPSQQDGYWTVWPRSSLKDGAVCCK